MDTSDSEAFQSADEDFDDEITVKFSGKKRFENEVKSAHVSDTDSRQIAISCGPERIETVEEEESVSTKIGSVELCDDENKEEGESKSVDEPIDTESDGEANLNHGGYADPPIITECWEYESWEDYKRTVDERKARENAERGAVEKDDTNKSEIVKSGPSEIAERFDKSAEDVVNVSDNKFAANDWDNDFGGWDDDDDVKIESAIESAETNKRNETNAEDDVKNSNTERGGYGIPPRRPVCWEMEKHVKNNRADDKTVGVEKIEKIEKTDEDRRRCQTGAKEGRASDVFEDAEKNDWDNDFDDWDEFESTDESEKRPTDVVKKTEPDVAPLFEKLTDKNSDGWGNWGGWGVSSLLSTATGSVQTFTSQVSQGLSTVIESSIGIMSAEELARMQKLEKEEELRKEEAPIAEGDDRRRKSESGVFGLGNLITGVGHITKLVETTGSKVVSTGLDTLEVIGKKTMEVLQEGDPGLVKKRALFGLDGDRPVLSQLLREAKERAEADARTTPTVTESEKRRVRYETLFDDNRGLVHLEALEMLSKQCEIKLESIVETTTGDALEDLRETLVQVKELCELPEEDDDEDDTKSDIDALMPKLDEAVVELGISLSYEKFAECWRTATNDVEHATDVDVVHEKAIETLAKLTSIAVEQFHRAAELLLIKERRSTADEADSLVRLTVTVSTVIGAIAAKFSEKLDSLSTETDGSNLNSLITNVFFEATNSSSYVRDAFQLLVPILQAGAV